MVTRLVQVVCQEILPLKPEITIFKFLFVKEIRVSFRGVARHG